MGLANGFTKGRKDPLETAPYLFPWYVQENRPRIVRDGTVLEWQYHEKVESEYVGIVTLNLRNNAFALFRIYDYIYASPTGTEFCVWRQTSGDEKQLQFDYFHVSDLPIIPDVEKKMLELNADSALPYYFECPPRSSLMIDLKQIGETIDIEFPDDFRSLDDFIAVVKVEGLYENEEFANTALLEIMPHSGSVSLHPQDWFNQDPQIDLGYQWITRATRDPITGRIVGEGIRIGRFELDGSNRRLR